MENHVRFYGTFVHVKIMEYLLEAIADRRRPLVLVGPAGSAKTLLAHGVSRLLNCTFRAPHHTASKAAMVGPIKDPGGECAQADGGILFLDDISEFSKDTIAATASAWVEGWIRAKNAEARSDFWPILAANACACGQGVPGHHCPTCTGNSVDRGYQFRLAERVNQFRDCRVVYLDRHRADAGRLVVVPADV